jgi:hypothetical protein
VVSFLIFKNQSKLFHIMQELKSKGIKVRFEEVKEVEILTFKAGCLDIITTFIPDTCTLTTLVVNGLSQTQFSYYQDKFPASVSGKQLLETWKIWRLQINEKIEAVIRLEQLYLTPTV